MLTGVAIRVGWQSIVAYVNIASYYLIGIPIGVVLGYVANLQVKVSYLIPICLLIFNARKYVENCI